MESLWRPSLSGGGGAADKSHPVTATILANALLGDGRHADIRIVAGRIAGIDEPGGTGVGFERIDLGGALLVPGLVDGHIHLDKTLLGLPFQSHRPGDTVAERIAREKEIRRELAYPVEERAKQLIRRVVAHGTTALRSEVGLAGLEALLELREAVDDLIGIEIVAFPQSGIMTDEGTADLLGEAVRA